MKMQRLIILLLLFAIVSCKKEDDLSENFISTDVFVKIEENYTVDKVFNFINSFDHDVESFSSQVYTSDLPSDSFQYVLDYLNAKPYTHEGNNWFVSGYLNYNSKAITIFPKFFNIKNKAYQKDWLESMEILKLNQNSGCIIYFHVTEGEEEYWKEHFDEYDFVEWTQLNHTIRHGY